MSRDFWKMNEDVCFGRANGKILWQPRIGCWYNDKIFADGHLPGRYNGMTVPELYRDLGCSNRIYNYRDCLYPVYDDTVKYEKVDDGQQIVETFETPVGNLKRIRARTTSTWALDVKKQWCCDEHELQIYTYIERHTDWAFDMELYEKTKEIWGDLGAPTMFIPRVNLERLYIDIMGVEDAVYTMMDAPEVVDEYFEALHETQVRMMDVINACPVKIINFGDNIHSGTTSPDLFEKYVLPEYQFRCKVLHAGGKFLTAHFDGDNRGLMQFYRQTGLDGIEAITPEPQGDVTLEEVHENLGDMFLVDGIPAVYFDDTYPVETLIECTHKILDLFAPNLILGISDEISSTGDVERIRLVGEIVDEYNRKIDEKLAAQAEK